MTTLPELSGIEDVIVCRAGYHGGRPFVAGTGVSVGRIGVLYGSEGMTAEEIATTKGISLAQAHAAIAYYLRNRTAIDADLLGQDAENERIAEDYYRTGNLPTV